MTHTTLFHKTSKDAIQTWEIWTVGAEIHTRYGLLNGKQQTAIKTAKGKNIGKANETTPEGQAVLRMASMIAKKRDKNYHDTITEAMEHVSTLPMLAKDYFEHGHKIKDAEVFIQPKYDGVRCLARWDGEYVTLHSRGNKTYNVPHIIKALETFCKVAELEAGFTFDGEIYCHGMEFNDINGAVKKLQDSTNELMYMIYDIADETKSYQDRKVILESMFHEYVYELELKTLSYSATVSVQNNPDKLKETHDKLVECGFEGMIVRTGDLPYNLGYRSDKLLKYKIFEDAEFEILSVTNGDGKFEEMAIFTCAMDDGSGKTFNVVPKGTAQQRKDYLTNGAEHIGKMLTVKFFGRSVDNIPRFPVGKGIRLDEDMPS